jgi:hypothetical protein
MKTTAVVSSRLFVHRLRTGVCICGQPTAAHYGARNQFISCVELAEREAAQSAAHACTTAASARTVIELHAIAIQPDPRD